MVWYYRYLIYFGIFLSVITGYNIWANHEQSIGYDKAKVEYEKVIQDQKDIATQALITETAKVTVKEKELQEFKNNREVIDRANTKKVNALSKLKTPSFCSKGSPPVSRIVLMLNSFN